ncbi:MAG: hypothetical protein KA968_13135 [Chitinophagaceae bacterium]|jgi:hypothetical protein|nr:hypothetical protein [Chitinophagaceae bacterium]
MNKMEKFESISMVESDLSDVKGGDFSLRFNHTHIVGSYIDENGQSHTVAQRCSWWGFYETNDDPITD